MKRMRIALIGAGSMGTKHASVVARASAARLALVIDRDLEHAVTLAREHGATAARRLEAAMHCDAAIVATATPNHREVAMTLIEVGLPVLVEKPLASTSADVEDLIATADRLDRILMCGFVERFNPRLDPIFALARHGVTSLEALRVGPIPRRVHSSVVDDVLLHDLDLVSRLMGDDPVTALDAQADDWDAGAPWPETVRCQLEFASGATATLHASRVAAERRRVFTATSGSMSHRADLADAVGNPLARQFARLLALTRRSTACDRAAERAGIMPAHTLADRVHALIGATSCNH
jgi:predicted dehydrogenase